MLRLSDLKISLLNTGASFGGPAMALDFVSGALDPRITFSRGTNATLVDSTGKITYAPANVIVNSVGPTFTIGGTSTTVAGAAPDGTNAVRLTKTDATSPRYATWDTSFSSQSNTSYVVSAYYKYDGFNTTVSLEYNTIIGWGIGWVAPFNITASGITADVPANCTSGVQAIGDGWFRVWAAFTNTTVTSGTNPVILARVTGGTGTTVLTCWGQLEPVTYQTTPSTYNRTTASAYYGPRFDYDPVTLAPRGLLIEEARTNLLTYSDDWSNAAWTKTASTVTANATVSPDGTTNADKVAEDATTGTHWVFQTATTTAVAHTVSVFMKAAERTWGLVRLRDSTGNDRFAWFNLANGTVGTVQTNLTASITPFGSGWYRCVVTVSAALAGSNPCVIGPATADNTSSYTGTAGNGIFLYGAQLEAGAFATSYIPTVASTVSRSADVATMTGTNFSSWYNQSEGTIVAETALIAKSGASYGIYSFDDGTTNNAYPSFYSTGLQANSRVAGANIFTSNGTLSPITKSAFAYKSADYASSFNGATPTTQLSGAIPSGLNRLQIGAYNSFYLNGHIHAIAYYNTRLPNTQLQTLTAPSLAAPLALDFLSTTYTVGY